MPQFNYKTFALCAKKSDRATFANMIMDYEKNPLMYNSAEIHTYHTSPYILYNVANIPRMFYTSMVSDWSQHFNRQQKNTSLDKGNIHIVKIDLFCQ